MQIRLLTSIKDGTGWHNPGAVIDMEDDEARRLIRLKSAEEFKTEILDEAQEVVTTRSIQEITEELCNIDGVNEEIAVRLIEAGLRSVQAVAESDPKLLIAIKGIGARSVKKIQESAEDLLDEKS